MVLTNGTGAGTHLRGTRKGLDYDYLDVNRDGTVDAVFYFGKAELTANADFTPNTTALILLADCVDSRQVRGLAPVVVPAP